MLDLFKNAGWVAWPLALCSILAVAVMLERLVTMARLKLLEERAFMILQIAVDKGDDGMLRDSQIAAAPVTQIMSTLAEMRGASREAIENAAGISLALQRVRLRRYLGTLATIGATAPFIGLFGTVLGVMRAFHGMSQTGLSGERMAAGISEALSATALGLLVAVPSVIAYNFFSGRVQMLLLQIQSHTARLTPMLRERRQEVEAA
jgi:biopolymer transport protein ExbB